MSIEQLAIPLTGTIGGTVTPRDDNEKRNEHFEKYLTAIRGAKLSETQLQQLSEGKANDDRIRTIEKINERKAQSDDEQYRKLRGNGYTVGETRRGLDQIDKALERKTLDMQRDAVHQKAVQNADATEENQQARLAETGNTTAFQRGAMQSELPQVPGTMPHDVTINPVGQYTFDANAATLQPSDAANGSATAGVGEVAESGNTTRNPIEQNAINTSEQQTNHHATSAGKMAASLASVMAGMTPVSQPETARRHSELDMKMTVTMGSANMAKVNAKDNITQEALTSASETQQAANDPGQSQSDSNAAQAAKDVAVTQSLPNTSLMERIDQARLVNRVAGAFRSLANQNGTIRMKLHPEELGALTIRMQIEAGSATGRNASQITAKLEAESETAKQILLENVETLKKKLKELNLEIAAFDIEVISTETNKTNRKLLPGQSVAKNKGNAVSEHVDYYS